MSISNIQRQTKINEFSAQLVQQGVEPNNFELNKMLAEYFDNHVLGMPYYSPKKQIPYEESSKDDYNHNFITLNEDINTIYAANIETNNRAVSLQEYYDTEKDKINNSIDELTQRVDNLAEALNSSVKIQEYVEAFDDLYNIEFYGKKEANIPATTAFIDLLQKKVHTEKSNAQMNRLSLDNSHIELKGLSNFGGYETSGELSKILSDSVTDMYIFIGRDGLNSEKTIDIYVDMGQLLYCNSVSFAYTSSRKMRCDLAISDNGNDFYSVYDIDSRGHVEWNFTARSIRYLKISCTKPEADGIYQTADSKFSYEYYYIFKNIQVALEGFQDKSILVTKPITFNNLTSTVTLNATDMIFNNTRIDYFIGFENSSGKFGWDVIENHKDHKLNMFDLHHNIANYGTSSLYAERSGLTNLYSIFKLPEGTNQNSLKVFPGYNAWAVNRFQRNEGLNQENFTLDNIDYNDFVKDSELRKMFMDCENYHNFDIHTNALYIFTQYINAKESNFVTDKFIKLMQIKNKEVLEDESTPEESETETPTQSTIFINTYEDVNSPYYIRIFMNGYECVTGDNGLYSFRLRKGMNKIQIAIYCPLSVQGDADTFKLYHNINFKQLSLDTFAFPPMKYTEPNILARTIEDESYEYYTIKDNIIYVKADPDDIINKRKEDMGYFLSYYSLKPDIDNVYESDKITFRIMAILNSDDKNMSPSIQSIRLTGK